MKVIMDMSNCEIEYETIESEYDDEVLCSGWNPEVDSVRQQLQLVHTDVQLTMPESVAMEVVELFLRKMYSYQR